MTQPEQFRQLVENSQTILVASHINPDPDALSSAGLLGATLRLNYPEKSIVTALEDRPFNLDDIPFYDDFTFRPMDETLLATRPDLLVITDTNAYGRISMLGAAAIRKYVSEQEVKTAIIDHHMPEGAEAVDLYIRSVSPAAAQDVYELLFNSLKLKKPEGFAELAMLGIVADSLNLSVERDYTITHKIIEELKAQGASREATVQVLERLSERQNDLLVELKQNRQEAGVYTFTFISDATAETWRRNKWSMQELKQACGTYGNYRMIEKDGPSWGFLVYPVLEDPSLYGLSFRSRDPSMDMSELTHTLSNGGGHKGAAGAKLRAASIEEVLAIVHQSLKQRT